MNRQKYDQIPQQDDSSPIILTPIHPISHNFSAQNYNYNSGLPNVPSTSTSTTPSIYPHPHRASISSIPNSPPPSFHTHSSPGTPRPTPSTTTRARSIASNEGGNTPSYAASLWGVAPSTTGETEMGDGMGSEALATIAGLKQRVEWLEESIGRLLLEKESAKEQSSSSTSPLSPSSSTPSSSKPKRDNCCVTFTDASPDLESALLLSSGSNCCVSFRGGRMDTKRQKRKEKLVVGLLLVFMVSVILILTGVLMAKVPRVRTSGGGSGGVMGMDMEGTGMVGGDDGVVRINGLSGGSEELMRGE